MIYLEDRTLMGFDISYLKREADHAAKQYHEPRYAAVRDWFRAVATAVQVERDRRPEGIGRFPVVVHWQPDPDVPRHESDWQLELVLSATAVVTNVERTLYARELRNAWHSLAVQLAELRDQRRRERSAGELIYGPIRGWGEGPDDA